MTEQGNPQLRLTRRRLLVAGGAAAGAAAVGVAGSYILNDGFEQHVADVLGIDLSLSRGLVDGVRERTGGLDFEARATAFITATTFPGSEILPRAVRERAIRSIVDPMIYGPSRNIAYLGLAPQGGIGVPCSGLIHR